MLIRDLQEIQKRQQQKVSDFYTTRGLHIYFKDKIENPDIDFDKAIAEVETVVPSHLMSEIEMIMVGHFEEFDERGINAFYADGMVCISNEQDDELDIVDDIVHEIAHSVEEVQGYFIYADNKVKNEFLNKRLILHDILWSAGYRVPKKKFTEVEYDQDFDMFLLQTVGYDKLIQYCNGIFISAYAPTSLREYFATGFTDFLLRSDSHNYMKSTCPQLYKKIYKLHADSD